MDVSVAKVIKSSVSMTPNFSVGFNFLVTGIQSDWGGLVRFTSTEGHNIGNYGDRLFGVWVHPGGDEFSGCCLYIGVDGPDAPGYTAPSRTRSISLHEWHSLHVDVINEKISVYIDGDLEYLHTTNMTRRAHHKGTVKVWSSDWQHPMKSQAKISDLVYWDQD
jgi:hypothetical protein